jgi:hypothetical protein
MKWSRAIWTILILTFQVAAAGAFYQNGNAVYESCQNTAAPFSRVYCLGYIVGIADALNGFRFCIPYHVTQEQIRDVVNLYLTIHPELRHNTAASLVASSLTSVFPCGVPPSPETAPPFP